MNDVFYGIALIPLIVGIVEVFKRAELLSSRFAAIAALLLGVVTTSGIAASQGTFSAESILTGIAFGLAASGLYSGVKAVSV